MSSSSSSSLVGEQHQSLSMASRHVAEQPQQQHAGWERVGCELRSPPKSQALRPRAPCAVWVAPSMASSTWRRQPHAPHHRPLGACYFCSSACSVLAAAWGKQGSSQRAAAARGPDGMWSLRHKRHGARNLGTPSWCGAGGPINGELLLFQRAAVVARGSQLACCCCCSPVCCCYCSAMC